MSIPRSRQRPHRLRVGVHDIALPLLEQPGHRGRRTDCGDLRQDFLDLDEERLDIRLRAAERFGDFDNRNGAERRLEAGQAEARDERLLEQVRPPLRLGQLLWIITDAYDLRRDGNPGLVGEASRELAGIAELLRIEFLE